MNRFYKSIAVIIVLGLLVASGIVWWFYQNEKNTRQLVTYFPYGKEELELIKPVANLHEVTPKDIYSWDERAFDKVEQNKTSDVQAAKFYTYLAVAQREFILLSKYKTGKPLGNIDVLSKKIFCEFFPSDCSITFVSGEEDSFSLAIANTVMVKIKNRIAQDDRQTKPYAVKTGAAYWNGPEPMHALEVGTWTPWVIESSDQFRVAPGPEFGTPAFDQQLILVQQALKNVTDAQRSSVVFWAGGPGTKTPAGIWIDIFKNYSEDNSLKLDKILSTRAALSMAMTDSFIGCFDSKYTFWTKRPFMVDPQIQTIMPTPNHPSYPAGHACVSGAAETILSHYEPEAKGQWSRMAKEAADSRVWGGIHYPIDNEAGLALGREVGNKVIEKMP